MAAKNGHLVVLRWARAHGCPWDEWTCAKAAENGHLAVLRWARAHGCPWDGKSFLAGRKGHEAVAAWAVGQGVPAVASWHAAVAGGAAEWGLASNFR